MKLNASTVEIQIEILDCHGQTYIEALHDRSYREQSTKLQTVTHC